MDYDFILKFETLHFEQEKMLEILQLTDTIHSDNISNQNSRILSQEEKKKYFQMLNQTEFDLLIEVYQSDFDLFGYESEIQHWRW